MTVTRGPNIRMSWNFDRYLLKVGSHEKSYRTFVGNAIYVSVPGLIDPRVIYHVSYLTHFNFSIIQNNTMHCFDGVNVYSLNPILTEIHFTAIHITKLPITLIFIFPIHHIT